MIVKVGTMSKPGSISSIKVITPAARPILPLYNLVISQPATGAQITSENSPIPGITKESIPIPSKSNPKNRFLNLWSFNVDIFTH